MKKVIGLLLISMVVFLNIDDVRAGEFAKYIEKGTCEVTESTENLCSYKCKVNAESVYGWLKFDFKIALGEVPVVENITADGVGFPHHAEIDDVWDIVFYQKNGSTGAQLIDDLTFDNALGIGAAVTLVLDQLTSLVTAGKVQWADFYVPTGTILKKRPENNYFFKNGDLVCRNVIPTAYVGREDGVIEDAVQFLSQLEIVTNIIEMEEDPEELKKDLEEQKQQQENAICGFFGEEDSGSVQFIRKIYKYIKIAIPVIIIALSIVDFVKVVGTGKDDDMKKAISKFAKRIVIAIVFILVPLLIQFIINISGVTEQYSGLADGIKALLCILG